MPDTSHSALLTLIACGGPSAPRRRLLEACGDAQAALAAGPAMWRACGLVSAQCAALLQPDRLLIARAEDWLTEPGHHLVGWRQPDYPSLLDRIGNPPLGLFVAGDPALLWHPAVAVVGSRHPSPHGREHAADFARAFARSGLTVSSGLAAGIDTAAHGATLAVDGRTLAVLGTGTDVAYPRGNTRLLAQIAERGAVVSEYLPGTGPRKEHFPARNRILAGLSLGTLVVEAAERSGALITARLAADAGREVFALPGSIHNPLARGCHRLLREGVGLAESPQEVIAALRPMAERLAEDLRERLASPTSPTAGPIRRHTHVTAAQHDQARPVRADDEGVETVSADNNLAYKTLWRALGDDPTDMDQLTRRTGLTPAILSSMLLIMELDGRVATQHGRYYRAQSAFAGG